jgi:multiple sugar transport system substrate-binding protein
MFEKFPAKMLLIAVITVAFAGCSWRQEDAAKSGRTQVDYWEFWTNFEFKAMQDVVDKFNQSQDKIYVNLVGVSEIQRKLLISIAGNDPPDIANVQDFYIPQFADKNALEPLDSMTADMGVKKEDYIDIFWELCSYRGKLYGLPTTPTTIGLHWDKASFRKAGLDPDKPPQTLEEFDSIAEKLLHKRANGNYEQMGFIQTVPGWWNYAWVWWFGGDWWDGKGTITANSEENVRAFEWIASYVQRYGARNLQSFGSSCGGFGSVEDGFLSGKLAMVIQGVWLSRFIKQYAPNMEWGAEAFPSPGGRLKDVSMAECTVLVIPRGARHKQAAAEFLSFVQRPENLEYLAVKQNKFVPLKIAHTMDYSHHPNKEIQMFVRLSGSPNIHGAPRIPIWPEYVQEINNAFDEVWLQRKSAKQALDDVQTRVEAKWADYCRIQAMVTGTTHDDEKKP